MNTLAGWLPAPILIPLGAAFVLPLLGRFAPRLRALLAISAMAAALAVLLVLAEPVFDGAVLVYWMGDWTPRTSLPPTTGDVEAVGISLVADAWSMVFALVTAGLGLAAAVYSTAYLRAHTGHGLYYTLLLLLVAGLLGFCLSGDLFNQFVWLEVFSVAAFALTGFDTAARGAVTAAFKYLITNSLAALFIALGLAVLYLQTGALNLAEVARALPATPAAFVGLGLLAGGYATKAALVPWHFWLPDAHGVAPSPVSALFSGALIKIGLYALGRCLFTLAPLAARPLAQDGLLFIGILNIFIGSLQMLRAPALKRVLAFSSVAQIGYMLLGLALGTPAGLGATALFVVHHALAKGALFLGAGVVRAGTGRPLPLTTAALVLSAAALAGVPLTGGYLAKTVLEEAARAHDAEWLAVVMIVGSALTMAGLVRALWQALAGSPSAGGGHENPAEAGSSSDGPPTRAAMQQPPQLSGPRSRAVSASSGFSRVLIAARDFRYPPRSPEAPLAMLLPLLTLAACTLVLAAAPAAALHTLGEPAGRALADRETYITAVLGVSAPVNLITAPAQQKPKSPSANPAPFDLAHLAPAVLALALGAGILLAPRAARHAQPLATAVRAGLDALSAWHSGLVQDEVLWTAFGTALVVTILLLVGVV